MCELGWPRSTQGGRDVVQMGLLSVCPFLAQLNLAPTSWSRDDITSAQ